MIREEGKLRKMKSEMIISTEKEKGFPFPQILSPIHKAIPSQSIHSEGLLNEMEGRHYSIKTPTFIIDVPPKLQFSIGNYNIFNSHQCKNQEHQGKYLSFDNKKKEVICLRCNEEGMIDNDLEKLNESFDETIDELTNRCMTNSCLGYPCFICIDCCDYICFSCYSNQHETHKTNSVPYIANSFRDEVNSMHQQLKNCVDQLNLINIDRPRKKEANQGNKKENNSKDNKQLKEILDLIPISNQNILLRINNPEDNGYQEYCNSFQSNDKEASDIEMILSKMKSQYNEIENSFNELLKGFNDQSIKNINKCDMVKRENEAIIRSKTLIKGSTNCINRLTQLKYNIEKNKNSIALKQDQIIKSTQAFEESVLFSIKSGSNNNAIHLNRFRSFVHNSMIYFKTTSVAIKSSQTIHLTGVDMCGLYIHKQRLRNPNNELQKIENRDNTDISLSLFKVKEGYENVMIINERKKLYGAVNPNDPIISLYLSNGVIIERGSEYLITVDNLNTVSNYGDFWSGSAFTKTHAIKQQELVCNSTGIEVAFSSPLGVQSDFDEFSNGLIAGIIFTTN